MEPGQGLPVVPSAKNDKSLFVANKVMSWKTTCIEVPKNATDGVDDTDETFEDEFKDYSKK